MEYRSTIHRSASHNRHFNHVRSIPIGYWLGLAGRKRWNRGLGHDPTQPHMGRWNAICLHWIKQLLEDGFFENDTPGRFNYGFGVYPDQVEPFFEGFGFQTIDLLSLEGFTTGLEPVIKNYQSSNPICM
jgi:hypothetical protein